MNDNISNIKDIVKTPEFFIYGICYPAALILLSGFIGWLF